MRNRVPAVALVVVAFLAGACGRLTKAGGGVDHPTGANDLILRVDTGGGFVAPGYSLRQIPQLSLFGDGRLITEGPQIEIYPGPALPNVVQQTLTEDGIQAILDAAGQAGLMGPSAHYDFGCIADAPTTTFTLVANGERHVVSAYALGMGEGACPGADTAARAKLAAFQTKLGDLTSWLPQGSVGAQTSYEPAEMRVYVQPYAGSPDPGLVEPPMDWKLSQPLSSFGQPAVGLVGMRCGVVAGQDMALLLPEARAANELTPWRSDGQTYSLLFRPLLPDEHTC